MAEIQGLSEILARLESSRQQTLSKMKSRIVMTVAASVIAGLLALVLVDSDSGMIALAFVAIVGYFFYKDIGVKAKAAFKSEIIPLMLKNIDPSLTYQATGSIPKEDYKASELFKEKVNDYEGQDLVKGQVGATKVRFSMIHATEYRDESNLDHMFRDSDSTSDHRSKETVTVFKGLLLVADFNKHFSSRTLLNQSGNSLLKDIFGAKVELEDPEFNQLFSVQSTDPVEARYILSPSLMEKLKTLRRRCGFRASFYGESLYLAVEMPYDSFEPDLNKPFTDASQASRILDNLLSVTRIVEDLGLNTRIWSKDGSKTLEAVS